MGMDDHSVNSPFSTHSARSPSFGSFGAGASRPVAEDMRILRPRQLEGHCCAAWVFLLTNDWSGRNLMISGAQDDIDCELLSRRTHLILNVNTADGTDLPENAYYATVWAGDSGDDLVYLGTWK